VIRTLLAQNIQSPERRRMLLERVTGLRQSVGLPPPAEAIEALIAEPSDAVRSSLNQQLEEIESRNSLNNERATAAAAGRPSGLSAFSALLRTLLTSLALAIGWRDEDLSPLLIWQLNREMHHPSRSKAPRPGSRQAAKQFISQLSEEDRPTS
jgi:hypothetical protein